MGVLALDHFTIRTRRWGETADFFERVIGLTPGPRPGFSFPGCWMYAGGRPLLHIASVDVDQQELRAYLGDKPDSYGSGALDHVSLRCEGLDHVQMRLQSLGIAFRERVIPDIGEHQLFLEDPKRHHHRDDLRVHTWKPNYWPRYAEPCRRPDSG